MSLPDFIRISPTAAEVSRMNVWLDEKLASSGVERRLGADLKLCLNEIVANLIFYAFADVATPEVFIEISLRPGRVSATVLDNGAHFDLRDWSIRQDRDLLTGELGGFGIPLIRERASRIAYERSGDLNRLEIDFIAANS